MGSSNASSSSSSSSWSCFDNENHDNKGIRIPLRRNDLSSACAPLGSVAASVGGRSQDCRSSPSPSPSHCSADNNDNDDDNDNEAPSSSSERLQRDIEAAEAAAAQVLGKNSPSSSAWSSSRGSFAFWGDRIRIRKRSAPIGILSPRSTTATTTTTTTCNSRFDDERRKWQTARQRTKARRRRERGQVGMYNNSGMFAVKVISIGVPILLLVAIFIFELHPDSMTTSLRRGNIITVPEPPHSSKTSTLENHHQEDVIIVVGHGTPHDGAVDEPKESMTEGIPTAATKKLHSKVVLSSKKTDGEIGLNTTNSKQAREGQQQQHKRQQAGHDKRMSNATIATPHLTNTNTNTNTSDKHENSNSIHIIHDNNRNNHDLHPHQHHYIPNILIFTYHTNLLTTPSKSLSDPEDVALQRNIHHTISLHPNSTVRFLTDTECIRSIRNVLGNDTPLVRYFINETKGMYKADICRGAALYETGGLYFDVDIEARMNVFTAIPPPPPPSSPSQHQRRQFVVPLVHRESNHVHNFFQAFIGASSHHPILLWYLRFFIDHYRHRRRVDGPLGVILLRDAYDATVRRQREEETRDKQRQHRQQGEEEGDKIGHVTLFQEVKYHPKLFPDVAPPFGARRACRMVVVSPVRDERTGRFLVPFYSRVRGSRMCGGKESVVS